MDLRTGQPLWSDAWKPPGEYSPLTSDVSCDVAVLGAGITGAMAAYTLTREGLETVLLDKRDVGSGSTAASTALLLYEVDVPLADLERAAGEEAAVRVYRIGLEAVDTLESCLADLGDRCGFERKPSLYIASRESDVPGLKEEFRRRKRAGFAVEYLEPSDFRPRFSFDAPGAILSRGLGQVDPYRLTHRLVERAAARGLRVHGSTVAASFERGKGKMVITTDKGPRITARRVVFATGYESAEYLKQDVGKLTSTFVAASAPIEDHDLKGWFERCMVWETARPYFYFRGTPDKRVLMGGEDEPYAETHSNEVLIASKAKTLLCRFRALFPDAEVRLSHAWAGTFGESSDGLPYIGETAEFPGACFALGFGGNGITFGVAAARILADLCLGRPNPDARLFRFDR